MTCTSVIAVTLVALLSATSHAQQPAAESPAWQTVAATLPTGAFVEIKLKDGRTFRGTVLGHGVETLRFKAKGACLAEIAFRDIDSLEPQEAPVMSRRKKVAIGVASAMAVMVILGRPVRWFILAIVLRGQSDGGRVREGGQVGTFGRRCRTSLSSESFPLRLGASDPDADSFHDSSALEFGDASKDLHLQLTADVVPSNAFARGTWTRSRLRGGRRAS